MTDLQFDWADLAFGSKKPLKSQATFIAAPRELSAKRFSQLVKEHLPKGSIVFGFSKEDFIEGFEGQAQFKTLHYGDVESVIKKVNAVSPSHKVYSLHYFQRELPFILEKLQPKNTVFINGSWKHLFHSKPTFYTLVKEKLSYQLVSPFQSDVAAKEYANRFTLLDPKKDSVCTEQEMLKLADDIAKNSFDYGFQTGVSLGKKSDKGYQLIATAFNEVVPYQTYAMHNGASRETHFSPMHDLNHYDTVHAEVALIVRAQKENINLRGTTLFINLLPCPSCARMFVKTDIEEFVYREDHSEGYAITLLEMADKKVRRVAK